MCGVDLGHAVNTRQSKRLTLTVEEAATLIGISRAQAYRCVRNGQLRAVQLGRRIVVPIVAVEELLCTSLVTEATTESGAADREV
jgi:excisionase family DNA binding protein